MQAHAARAAKSDFLVTISHIMKFSKDIVLKLDARTSHKHDPFPQPHLLGRSVSYKNDLVRCFFMSI